MEDNLASMLAASRDPLGHVEVEIEVYGVFSLPDSWKPGDAEPPDYNYQLSMCGLVLSNGKMKKRQLTEEEIQAAEEAKKTKKDTKKKPDPDPTPEELEEMERVKQEKLERERQLQEEWERLDETGRFHRTMEDIYKHPCIKWEEEHMKNAVTLKETDLIHFEEAAQRDGGVWMDVSRLLKTNEEEAKKKPKGKGAEELKPAYGKAWIDLTHFRQPGLETIELRAPVSDQGDGEEEAQFEGSNAYVYIQLRISPSLVPAQSIRSYPTFTELIPTRPPPPKFLPSIDASHDFRRQVKLATRAVAAEYFHMFEAQLQDKAQLTKDQWEQRKESFLYDFNLSGKSQVLKSKLKKSIVKIAREQNKKQRSLKGLAFNEKDNCYTELYAYLIGQINVTLEELYKEQRQKLHEEIYIPKEQAVAEYELAFEQALGESASQKLRRLAEENEFKGLLDKATAFHKERIAKAPRQVKSWMDFTYYCLRQRQFAAAEEAIVEVIALLGPESGVQRLLLAAAVCLQTEKLEACSVLLLSALEQDPNHIIGNLLASFLYKRWNKPELETKYTAFATRVLAVHLGLSAPVAGVEPPFASLEGALIRSTEGAEELSAEQLDDLYYILVEYLMNERLYDLAAVALEYITTKETSMGRFTMYTAQIRYWQQQYEECLEVITSILAVESRHVEAWTLRGNAYFQLGQYDEAEHAFIRVIRYAPKVSGHIDYKTFLRLGEIYIRKSAWADAEIVFAKSCKDTPTALSWEGLGLACLQLGKLKEAEDALLQANCLDENNPKTWLSLALLSLRQTTETPGQYFKYKQFLKQSLRLNAKNPALLMQIAEEYLRKFFVEGVQHHLDKFDVRDPAICYQTAQRSLEDPQEVVSQVNALFDELSSRDNTSLNQQLVQQIEQARLQLLEYIS